MSKSDLLRIPDYLKHILQAIERIFSYAEDLDPETFQESSLTQDAILRNLEILGEASRNLLKYHPDFIAKFPDVPWEEMYWMRNRISHGYFSVDFAIVWKTVETSLPGLEKQIQEIVKNIEIHLEEK